MAYQRTKKKTTSQFSGGLKRNHKIKHEKQIKDVMTNIQATLALYLEELKTISHATIDKNLITDINNLVNKINFQKKFVEETHSILFN